MKTAKSAERLGARDGSRDSRSKPGAQAQAPSGAAQAAQLAREHAAWIVSKGERGQRAVVTGRLDRAQLPGADLQHAIFTNVSFRNADLRRAKLQDAVLEEVSLVSSTLREAQLDRARLVHCRFAGATLEGASLENANLEGSDLRGAILRRASLKGASLSHADLRNARLGGVPLDEVEIKGALFDLDTIEQSGWSRDMVNDLLYRGAIFVGERDERVTGVPQHLSSMGEILGELLKMVEDIHRRQRDDAVMKSDARRAEREQAEDIERSALSFRPHRRYLRVASVFAHHTGDALTGGAVTKATKVVKDVMQAIRGA